MDIPALGASPASSSKHTSGTQSDYQTFLTMLTVQMQNQDPLNPANATEFAVQLATFAGVEQQTYTNQLLGRLLGDSGLADLGRWIGMDALTEANAQFDGAPITLSLVPKDGADDLLLTVRDASDAVVDSRRLAASATTLDWDGVTPAGDMLAHGAYRFELESFRDGESLGISPAAHFTRVLEVRQDDAGASLILSGNRRISSDDIIGLRAPQTR